jgi:hypothetical protein
MAQISEKIQLVEDLQQILKKECNIPNVGVMEELQGLHANILPDGWEPTGPIPLGYSMRVLIDISDVKDNWKKVLQKADDFALKIQNDCRFDLTKNDKKIILASDLESVTRVDDDTDFILQVAVLVNDVRQQPAL